MWVLFEKKTNFLRIREISISTFTHCVKKMSTESEIVLAKRARMKSKKTHKHSPNFYLV